MVDSTFYVCVVVVAFFHQATIVFMYIFADRIRAARSER